MEYSTIEKDEAERERELGVISSEARDKPLLCQCAVSIHLSASYFYYIDLYTVTEG
jgi:hypothetical protein